MKLALAFLLVSAALFAGTPLLRAGDLPDITTVPEDLKVPAISEGAPAAGLRVVQTSADWKGTAVHHTICLPVNWKPGGKFPVLVDYADRKSVV